jgi:dipeptidyl aminopeptidase/acylaminoacyl peptidase
VLYRMVNRGDDNLFLIDLHTGEERLLTPHEGPASSSGGLFSPDGRTMYLASNVGREMMAFGRVVIGTEGLPGSYEVLAARDDAELESVVIDEEGTVAALLWNLAGRNMLELLDLTNGHTSGALSLPTEIVGGLTVSRDGRLLAMTAQGATAPADIWVLDRTTGNLQQVTHSPHAGVDLKSLIQPELIRFPAHDGLTLSGWLYRPRAMTGPLPVVLSFHGGPEGQERPAFNSTYQALLAQGIAVLAPNVRGSSGFGKTFVNLDNGSLRVDAVRDIRACITAVVERGIGDPQRIGIMGGSYGGYMTMAGLAAYPELFAAGANLFGVVNFATFFAHTEPWMAAISKVEYGDPDTQAEMLRDLSPINKIDRVTAPTIVLHGANDTNVPVVEAEQVVDRLRQPTKGMALPGSPTVSAPQSLSYAGLWSTCRPTNGPCMLLSTMITGLTSMGIAGETRGIHSPAGRIGGSPQPDTRTPLRTVSHQIWPYERDTAVVLVSEPPAEIAEGIARQPYDPHTWRESAIALAVAYRERDVEKLLGVRVHPPEPPADTAWWDWLLRN